MTNIIIFALLLLSQLRSVTPGWNLTCSILSTIKSLLALPDGRQWTRTALVDVRSVCVGSQNIINFYSPRMVVATERNRYNNTKEK